ncbi:MAG: ribonuclease P protein component [Sulfuritalea sp.]|nr:ribonuclease P protein component [Sulfuritalea sp.]
MHRPEEFAAVLAARRVVRGSCFDLHFCPAPSTGRARLGLIVSKRLARAAALRNAVKRQGREAFRLLAPAIPPCDLVLRLKQALPGFGARDGEQRKIWRAEMEALLGRVKA